MNVENYMSKHGITDADLDAMAKPYEQGDYPHEDAPVHTGSHLDVVGKRRITVVYDARDTQRVISLAHKRGVKPSVVYRDALECYLASQGA